MALSKTLLCIALALAIVGTITAQRGNGRNPPGGRQSQESSGDSRLRGGRAQDRSKESDSSEGHGPRGFRGLFGPSDSSDASNDEESEDSSPESRSRGGILGRIFTHFAGRGDSSSAEGDRRRGDRLMEPCKFENVASPVEPTPSKPSEDRCGEFARCDTTNAAELADAIGTVLYKVSFCRLDYNALVAHLGNNTCDGPTCFGPFSIPGGAISGLRFCGTENEALTIDNIRRCRNQRPRGDSDEMESSEEMPGDGEPAGPEEMGPGDGTETSATTTMRPAPVQ